MTASPSFEQGLNTLRDSTTKQSGGKGCLAVFLARLTSRLRSAALRFLQRGQSFPRGGNDSTLQRAEEDLNVINEVCELEILEEEEVDIEKYATEEDDDVLSDGEEASSGLEEDSDNDDGGNEMFCGVVKVLNNDEQAERVRVMSEIAAVADSVETASTPPPIATSSASLTTSIGARISPTMQQVRRRLLYPRRVTARVCLKVCLSGRVCLHPRRLPQPHGQTQSTLKKRTH